MTKEKLELHVQQEHDENNDIEEQDIVSSLRENRLEVRDRLFSIQKDINTVNALENFASSIYSKKELTNEDVFRYNELIELSSYNTTGINYSNVSLESFDSLINTVSNIGNTTSNVANKTISAAHFMADKAVEGAQLAKLLYERVQSGIVKIAASWDIVCSMIEKRWLGLSQLVKVYELQHQNLQEKFDIISQNKGANAFFTVKLYVAKLRNDGRDIKKKENLLNAFTLDSRGISELGEAFIKKMVTIKRADDFASQALTLRFPYKKALAINANVVNKMLKDLSKNALFYEGGVTKPYQAQSRVLLGGKVININYNEDEIKEETSRKDFKTFIGNLSFTSVKKRDGNQNDTENVEISAMSLSEANTIFSSVAITNEALKSYHDSNIPSILRSRQSVSSLIKFGSGLTGGAAAFDSIKSFFNREDNLKAFNLVAPVAVSKLLGTFLAASTFAVFSSIVAASAAAYIVDYLRKYIIANVFSMMDFQYRITDIIEKFDHDYIDTLIEIHNQGYRVCKKLASNRSWEY